MEEVWELWEAAAHDRAGFLEECLAVLQSLQAPYCFLGDVAVASYVEPLLGTDIEIALAPEDAPAVSAKLATLSNVSRFRVRITADTPLIDRSTARNVLGVVLPVASAEDVLQGKIWAYSDTDRRQSKRAKDLADISRLIESYPALRAKVPSEVLAKLP
jgi:hypothetical protein